MAPVGRRAQASTLCLRAACGQVYVNSADRGTHTYFSQFWRPEVHDQGATSGGLGRADGQRTDGRRTRVPLTKFCPHTRITLQRPRPRVLGSQQKSLGETQDAVSWNTSFPSPSCFSLSNTGRRLATHAHGIADSDPAAAVKQIWSLGVHDLQGGCSVGAVTGFHTWTVKTGGVRERVQCPRV